MHPKQLVKDILHSVAPERATAYFAARARLHAQKVVKGWGCLEINDKLISHYGSVVQEGPLSGLVLSPMTHSEHLGPYLLGVYESELDKAWETVFGGAYPQIIDVGAKFGFYAIGLAKRFPHANILAFDTDEWARRAVLEMAAANSVTNVEVRGLCDAAWLATHLQSGAFIISDCDGFEGELFCSKPIPNLTTATIIIETHDAFTPGVHQRLQTLLEPTHTIQDIPSGAGRRESSRSLDFLTEPQRQLANNEVRPPQAWLFCLPKQLPH